MPEWEKKDSRIHIENQTGWQSFELHFIMKGYPVWLLTRSTSHIEAFHHNSKSLKIQENSGGCLTFLPFSLSLMCGQSLPMSRALMSTMATRKNRTLSVIPVRGLVIQSIIFIRECYKIFFIMNYFQILFLSFIITQ